MIVNSDKNKLSETIPSVNSTYQSIREILEKAKSGVYRGINFAMVLAYWNIGKVIVEEEQQGKERAEYGKALIKELSARLTKEYGKGFDESNLRNIRQFYITFPNCDALRHELTWTHYRLLLRIEKEDARNFYIIETVDSNWSTRELESFSVNISRPNVPAAIIKRLGTPQFWDSKEVKRWKNITRK